MSNRWPGGGGEMASRIRDLDWVGTPLGTVENWSERLKVMVEQVLASPLVSTLVCGPERVLIYNDAAAKLYGERHPAALGRPLPERFPEGWATVAPFYERAFAGETVQVTQQPLDTHGRGDADEVFDALLTPVREADGHVAYIHMTGIEIGDRVRTEAALRESEARHRLLIEIWAQAEWDTDPDGVVVADSPSWRAYTGQTLEEWFGYGWLDAIHPEDRPFAERQWRDAVAAHGLVNAEFRLRAPDGGWRWTNVRAAPVLDSEGKIAKWAGLNVDIDARKRAETALQEDEERQRFLLELSDALRAEPDADAVANRALKMLFDHLRLDRCYIGTYRSAYDRADLTHQVGNDRVPPLPPSIRLSDFPNTRRVAAEGTLVIEDFLETPGLSEADRQNYAGLGLRALVAATIRKGENNPQWATVAVSSEARRWTRSEITVLEEAAERIWAAVERARAEAALRDSEAKYRTLFETMGQGYVLAETVRDADGRPTDMRLLEVNPAYERLMGVSAEQARGRGAYEILTGVDRWWLDTCDRVARAGRPERVEHQYNEDGGWFEAWIYPRGGDRYEVLFEDITERKRAEAMLRESEERQAFLLQLSDALRPLVDAEQIKLTACRILGRHLGASRAYFVLYEPELGYGVVGDDYMADGLPSLAGRYPFEPFRSTYERLSAGETWIVPDVAAATELPVAERDFYAAQGVRAWVDVPLANDGALEAAFCVVQSAPRAWTPAEIFLIEQTADRLWSALRRGRAEAARRESEERFRQFADASAAGLWIRDAATLAMEYASPAVAEIYGVDPEDLLGPIERWAATVIPEDRDSALAHIDEARAGCSVTHEFRIQRASDNAFRWIRSTDFPLHGDGDIQRVGGIAEDVTDAKLAVEHQGVLLAELQHRVRNIMAIIRSTARRTADGAADVQDYRALLEGRLLALARVQVLLTRAANAGGSLREIIESEVSVQAAHQGQFELAGPDVRLSPKAVEVLTLAFHELATNALKYGAFSVPSGRLRVAWSTIEKRDRTWLALDWMEEGAPPRGPVTRRGFGSDLIEGRIPYELGGTGKVVIGPSGAHCRLEFPLMDGESILETDTPAPAVVFGGILDMTDAPDLTGRRVLVVEDDYYMAGDTAAALRAAGAAVLGPCPSEDATRELLDRETPTHAVLDLHLGGGGPRFEIAHLLKARGVPFVFLTGYDPDVIPPDLADVVRLQKPAPFRTIVEAVSAI